MGLGVGVGTAVGVAEDSLMTTVPSVPPLPWQATPIDTAMAASRAGSAHQKRTSAVRIDTDSYNAAIVIALRKRGVLESAGGP